jgi:shikimate dehydrogenase-like protein
VLKRAAVLGKPIAHSLSPVIHNSGYQEKGLEFSYSAIECDSPELAGFVAGLGPEWVGLSLTMPLKEVALDVADSVSDIAQAVGAANTLVRRPDGHWRWRSGTSSPNPLPSLVPEARPGRRSEPPHNWASSGWCCSPAGLAPQPNWSRSPRTCA